MYVLKDLFEICSARMAHVQQQGLGPLFRPHLLWHGRDLGFCDLIRRTVRINTPYTTSNNWIGLIYTKITTFGDLKAFKRWLTCTSLVPCSSSCWSSGFRLLERKHRDEISGIPSEPVYPTSSHQWLTHSVTSSLGVTSRLVVGRLLRHFGVHCQGKISRWSRAVNQTGARYEDELSFPNRMRCFLRYP